jgi:hypothetical protein
MAIAINKSMLMGVVVFAGLTVADAQAQYPAYPYNQVPMTRPASWQAPVAPPSAYYDPYTSGLGPCPQRYPGEPPCREAISPSYGQPSYWSR